jgi:cell division protein FtsI (penicillin-binding protein 3)
MNRALILTTVIVFGFVVVLLRLGDLMLLDHERLTMKANSQYLRHREIDRKRGLIFDRRGRELAMNVEVDSLYTDPSKLAHPQKAALEVSRLAGVSHRELARKVSVPGRHFVWIKRKLGEEEAARLRERLKMDGIGFATETERFYPKGALASHVLGFVDLDNRARAGIESMYDEDLVNEGGKVVLERDASGRVLSQGVELESKGNNVVLTLDEGLQYIAESALGEAMRQWKAEAATVVMMDPYTGEILAMANRPTFDPNEPGRVSAAATRNRAIMDLYEPGSTFKLVVGATAIEEKAIRPGQKFDCSSGVIEVGGRRFHDVHKQGVLSFEEVIQKSSNVGSIQIALRLGPQRLYDYAKRFGFGEPTGVDLPSEAKGRVRAPKDFSGTTVAAMAIGYEVSVTPLQVLRAYSAVANGGILPAPHIVSEVLSPEGDVLRRFAPEGRRALSEETANRLKKILAMVTEEGGTAQRATLEGNKVSGKTGTARLYDPKTKRYSGDYVSSFVGFVPSERPRIAMIVVIRGAKGEIYGGLVAAPVFSAIAERAFAYMNVPRDDTFKNQIVYLGEDGGHGIGEASRWDRN